ncbi:MAG TPA: hypothetical protein VF650_17555 [Allosphingosinicella sp.]
MARRSASRPVPESLTARIGTVAQSYFVAAEGDAGTRIIDEAILNAVGVIESIDARHQRFLGESLEMAFICGRSFERKGPTPTSDKPVLLPLQLGKRQRSLMVYLPSDAFWGLSRLIPAGIITHVEASFCALRYGTADLLSVHFFSSPKQD